VLVAVTLFRTPAEFAFFLTSTAVFSVGASVLLGKHSDTTHHRKEYIWVFGTLAFACTLGAAFAEGAIQWAAAIGLLNVALVLFKPFAIALTVDREENELHGMAVGREFFLNAGRVFSCLLLAMLLIWMSTRQAMIIIAFVILLYSFVLEFKARRLHWQL